jgi:hypothetical protein
MPDHQGRSPVANIESRHRYNDYPRACGGAGISFRCVNLVETIEISPGKVLAYQNKNKACDAGRHARLEELDV